MNARELAFDLLGRWRRSRSPADELLDRALAGSKLSIPDRALATELFYGVLRRKLALEFVIGRLAPKPPRPVVADILKLGLYQLYHLDRIPPHAAVNETVGLAKRHTSPAEARFVNALLRRAVDKNATYVASLSTCRDGAPWVGASYPQWLWERWVRRWGAEQAAALCEWNNLPPPVYARLNTLKAAAWPAEIPATATPNPLCWQVTEPAGLFATAAWRQGAFYVQDPSTLMAVDVLDPQPGESILDLCAAPGGKTTYIAQKMQNRGQITAADSSNSRLGLVAENCRRLGVTIVATVACDAGRCLYGRQFDRVLVDAPCSNTGVLRRRVDLRWRLTEPEIMRLAAVQERLLAAAAALTKRGGILVYSTCSLEPEENERVVERFRGLHPEVALDTTRSVFPPRDGVDGAYVVRFRL